MSEDDGALDRLRWWLSKVETTQAEELDCEAVFELLENAVEAARAGHDVAELFPALALHLNNCPGCQDLLETLVALAGSASG
jgi:predicted anti-sigma-YlaC factor YlaD